MKHGLKLRETKQSLLHPSCASIDNDVGFEQLEQAQDRTMVLHDNSNDHEADSEPTAMRVELPKDKTDNSLSNEILLSEIKQIHARLDCLIIDMDRLKALSVRHTAGENTAERPAEQIEEISDSIEQIENQSLEEDNVETRAKKMLSFLPARKTKHLRRWDKELNTNHFAKIANCSRKQFFYFDFYLSTLTNLLGTPAFQ